jgi:molecular chaperone HtpG
MTTNTSDSAAPAGLQTLGFQAEVRQLLQLMIHSLYSHHEIFLRELVSNASDACDRLRFEAIATPALLPAGEELAIEIRADPAARTITVSDNGIGMSRDEAVSHLGTIARSGTREFCSRLSGDQRKDSALIGQFGVGFYSAFIVADRVTVTTRRAGSTDATRWESDGEGEFTVAPAERAGRGTDVVLHLRAERDELLEPWKLRSILKRYSDHIAIPVRMAREKWDEEKKASVATGEMETVNQAQALWTRPRAEVSDEQYREFYRHVSHDSAEPLAWTHNRVEGRSEYVQLLYLPKKAPFDLWDRRQAHGLKLYVQRVFIMDDAEQLLPSYLRFVRGVVDSSDLPLNVSREILQESRDVRTIREGCAKRVLSLLEEIAREREADYLAFWGEFGQVLKEGMGEDPANAERIAPLLRFASTSTAPGEWVSLAQYAARARAGQKPIYYVTADSMDAARNSPHLEIFRRRGVEVLLLADRVDEWMLSFLTEFEGRPLASVARGDLDLSELGEAGEGEPAREEREKANERSRDLVAAMKTALGERVSDVRASVRLTDSPSCVVVDPGAMSAHLQRLLKSAGQKAPASAPILEINPGHPLVARLIDGQGDVGQWAHLLLEQAILAEGGQLEDPAAFVRRVNALLMPAAVPVAATAGPGPGA